MTIENGFCIEILYKKYVPDNVNDVHVFNDDQHILHFMANSDVFKDAAIEEDKHDQALQEASQALKGNTAQAHSSNLTS